MTDCDKAVREAVGQRADIRFDIVAQMLFPLNLNLKHVLRVRNLKFIYLKIILKSLLSLTPRAIKYTGIVIKRINQILVKFVSVNDIVHTNVVNMKRLMQIPIFL